MFRVKSILVAAVSFVALSAQAQFGDLAVFKSGPGEAAAGSNVAYDVTITNLGPDPASTVQLNDPIPAGMTFVSRTQNSGVAFLCTDPGAGNGGTVNCTTATMLSGASANFTFVFQIPLAAAPGTFFTNVATGSSQPLDDSDENNSGVAVTSTPPPAAADMSITKSGPVSAGPGTDVTYTISVTNGGPNAAANASWSDTLPGDMTFVSLVHTGWPEMSCMKPDPGAGGTITCTVVIFPVAYTSTYTLTGRIPAQPGELTYQNTATVSAATNDPTAENNSSTTALSISAVDVSVTKSSVAFIQAGSEINYALTVSNAGPDAAADIVLNDPLPPGTTFVSITQNSGPVFNCATPPPGTNGTVVCTIALLPANTTAQFTLITNSGSAVVIVNTATVTTASYDTNTGNNTGSTTMIGVGQSADLSVAKSGPATITAGTTITYSVTARNNGPSHASTVSLNDPFPTNATFVSLTQNSGPAFTCTPDFSGTGTIRCNRASMDAGTEATFTFVFNVSPSAVIAVNNTATISSAVTPEPNPGNNSSMVSAIVSQSADLSVTKSGPATIAAGAPITYTVTARNDGPSDALSVELSDTLPPNTTFVSATQTSGPAFTCVGPAVGSPGTITCNRALGFAPAATATFSFVLNVSPSATGPITNTAGITALTSDPAPGNNSSMTTATVGQSADLTVVKSAPATAVAGATLTYTLTASNVGPSNAANVVLTDLLPPDTTFASLNQTSGPIFNCTAPAPGGTGTVNCSIATLAGGGTSATFSLVVNVAAGATGSINNTANIAAATSDPTPGNNASTVTSAVTQSANLTVTKTAPATVVAGTTLTYTITASNAGPSNATNVSLTDTLPANTTFASVTQTSGPTFTCTAPAVGNAGIVNCSIATLAGGGTSAVFNLVVNVAPGATGSISNTANITAATTDPTPGNNTSTTSTAVTQSADLTVAKTGPDAVTAGSNITYTVTANNAGPSNATGVSLTDVLPANTTFVSATQTSGPAFICTTPPAGSPGTITCTAATFVSGATAVFSFVVNLAPAATGVVSNTAAITSATTDPTPGNSTSGLSSAIGAGPTDVSITKTADAASYKAGSDATFTLTVRNNGPGNAAGTTVTDVLPTGTTLVSATPTQGTCTGTTTVVCTLGALAPSTTATITLVLHLPQTIGPISNTATVTIANTETAPANNSSTATINVIAEIPALSPLALLLLAMMIAGVGVVMKR